MSLPSASALDIEHVSCDQRKSSQGSRGKNLQEWNMSEAEGTHGLSSAVPQSQ